MTNAATVVICDAGPLIHLDELDCIALLKDFHRVLVPRQVWDEVTTYRPELSESTELALEIVEVDLSTSPSFRALVLAFALDLGEQAALSLIEHHPAAIFLTDDAAARLAANTLDLRVHGTLGILVRAVRRKQRSREEILTILRQLPERSSLHIKQSLLDEVIGHL